MADEWENPAGVPIDAFLFGGRRATAVPLVREAFDWEHAVFLGSTMSSEQTAAATGTVGQLRFDPFAMLPFCGYDMGQYFRYWLDIGQKHDPSKLPRIFYVNWFRKGADGSFLWPGFGDNVRVLAWIVRRLEGKVDAVKTPVGLVPAPGDLDVSGLDITPEALAEVLAPDLDVMRQELSQTHEHLARFENLPAELHAQMAGLVDRLGG